MTIPRNDFDKRRGRTLRSDPDGNYDEKRLEEDHEPDDTQGDLEEVNLTALLMARAYGE